MIERVTKENLDQYEAFIKKHPKGLFQHSSKWAKVKSAWKWEAVMLRDEDGNIKGSADVLIRTVPVEDEAVSLAYAHLQDYTWAVFTSHL